MLFSTKVEYRPVFCIRRIALLTILLCLNTAFAQTNRVGYVAKLVCSEPIPYEEVFKLKRGNYSLAAPAKLLQDIYPGDELSVEDFRCFMTLQLGDKCVHIESENAEMESFLSGKCVHVEYSYTVRSTKELPALLEWFRQVYERITSGPQIDSKPAVSRSAYMTELSMPMFAKLAKEEKLIKAGKTVLYLEWKGGLPPYRVGIYDSAYKEVFAATSKKEELSEPDALVVRVRLQFKKPMFRAGWQYFVEVRSLALQCNPDEKGKKGVRDRNWCVTGGTFRAVSAKKFPDMPEEDRLRELPENERESLFMAWLLAHQEEWSVEAYQKIAALRETKNDQAALLMEHGFQ